MLNDFLDPDNLGEPSKRISDFVAMIVVIVVVLLVCAFVYVASEIVNVTVEIFDEGANIIKDYSEKKSRQLEELQKELDDLEYSEKIYQMKQRELNRELRELENRY